MLSKNFCIIFTLALVCLANKTSAQCTYYTLQQGDTFALLASRWNIPVSYLTNANPSLNPLYLQVGQQICVPSYLNVVVNTNYVPSYTSCSSYYYVKSGDTCDAIIRAYNLNSYNFYQSNPGIYCQNLRIGQAICISSGSSSVNNVVNSGYSCTSYLIVQSGDYCYALSQKYGISLDRFVACNPNACSNLQIGQALYF